MISSVCGLFHLELPVAPKTLKNYGFHTTKKLFFGKQKQIFDGKVGVLGAKKLMECSNIRCRTQVKDRLSSWGF